jgi:hypothetical protein
MDIEVKAHEREHIRGVCGPNACPSGYLGCSSYFQLPRPTIIISEHKFQGNRTDSDIIR